MNLAHRTLALPKKQAQLRADPYYNPNLTKDHIDCRPA
jgi:hypothetical protein